MEMYATYLKPHHGRHHRPAEEEDVGSLIRQSRGAEIEVVFHDGEQYGRDGETRSNGGTVAVGLHGHERPDRTRVHVIKKKKRLQSVLT